MALSYSRLRRYRKIAQLSQREFGYLVGLRAQGLVSEIEAGLKHPSIHIQARCEIVFETPLIELYPVLYSKAQNEVFERALELAETLSSEPERADAAAYLAALISRLGGAHSTS